MKSRMGIVDYENHVAAATEFEEAIYSAVSVKKRGCPIGFNPYVREWNLPDIVVILVRMLGVQGTINLKVM